jgi:hypothetical protein
MHPLPPQYALSTTNEQRDGDVSSPFDDANVSCLRLFGLHGGPFHPRRRHDEATTESGPGPKPRRREDSPFDARGDAKLVVFRVGHCDPSNRAHAPKPFMETTSAQRLELDDLSLDVLSDNVDVHAVLAALGL